MAWAPLILAVVVCAALLFILGGAIALGLGIRGIAAVAAAPALTVTVTATTAIIMPSLGIDWSIWPVVAASVATAFLLWAGHRFIAYRNAAPLSSRLPAKPGPNRNWILVTAGFMAGAGTITWQMVRIVGTPGSFSQTFDNIFHLNVVRYILNTGNASSLSVSAITSGDNPPYFYPAAWHGLVALVIQLTDIPLPVAVNAVNVVLAAVVWTLGCMWLVRTVIGPRPWVVAFAGLLAAGFSSFPILLLDFGVLYPNFLSIALLPAGLSAVVAFFGVGASPISDPIARFALPVLLAPGIALAHPNGIMTLLALTVPVALYAFWKRFVFGGRFATHRGEFFIASGALIVALAGVAVLWKYVRPPVDAAFWDRYHSPVGSAWEIVTNSAMNRPEAWVVSALMLIGLYIAARNRQHWWLIGCFALTSLLFLVVNGVSAGYWRSLLTGVWYNDSYRIAAILPLTALPLAAIGFGGLSEVFSQAISRASKSNSASWRRLARSTTLQTVAGIFSVVVLAMAMQFNAMNFAVAKAAANYAETPRAEVVSSDELTLINMLDTLVPPGETIAVNPWTGGALAFALADRQTTSKHVLSTYSPAVTTINNGLRYAATDPEVCAAVRKLNVGYALDFGSQEVHGGHHSFPGLDDLSDSPAAQLVAEVGDAKLFRITVCR